MGLKAKAEKPVKIVQKKGAAEDGNTSPAGVLFVEKPPGDLIMGQIKNQTLNRAQIYQAVKRARMRSLNLNNDLKV